VSQDRITFIPLRSKVKIGPGSSPTMDWCYLQETFVTNLNIGEKCRTKESHSYHWGQRSKLVKIMFVRETLIIFILRAQLCCPFGNRFPVLFCLYFVTIWDDAIINHCIMINPYTWVNFWYLLKPCLFLLFKLLFIFCVLYNIRFSCHSKLLFVIYSHKSCTWQCMCNLLFIFYLSEWKFIQFF